MIQSQNDLFAAISNGQSDRQDWNKVFGGSAGTTGRWYELFSASGYPPASAFPGTALAFVNCSNALGDGTTRFGIPLGANVGPLIKHAITMAAWSTAGTGVPSVLKLVDLIGYYPGISMNSATAQTLTGTPTLRGPGWGGVRAALAIRTASGATAHNLSMSYTDQDGNAGATMPYTVSCTASAIASHLTHAGVATNNYGPELPLASGDTGIRSVQSITLSAASGAGTAALLLYRPITQIPLAVASLMGEKDFANQFPAFNRIPDDACLGFILGAGAAVAASTQFAGSFETVWG